MKYLSSIILTIVLLGIWGCEDLGEPIIEGCTDINACNYNVDATIDDDSCTSVLDVCGTCGGTIQNASDCCSIEEPADCANVCGGTASEDNCEVCDSNPSNDCVQDCAGAWGGSVVIDCAGTCGGDAVIVGSTCTNISYAIVVQPMFTINCTFCHGSSGGLLLTSYNSLMQGGNSGSVINPGNGSESLLIKKLRGTAPGFSMPQNIPCCLEEESVIRLIETWIDEGALEN